MTLDRKFTMTEPTASIHFTAKPTKTKTKRALLPVSRKARKFGYGKPPLVTLLALPGNK